jgi:hypothetical protein
VSIKASAWSKRVQESGQIVAYGRPDNIEVNIEVRMN